MLEHATRSFALVHERSRTLKELFVRRGGRAARRACAALDDVSLRIAPGRGGRHGRPQRRGQDVDAALPGGDRAARLGARPSAAAASCRCSSSAPASARTSRGRENIYLNGALHGFTREEIEERVERIVEFSELGDFIDVPVKAYSAGMYLRLGFSIVAHLDADVLLIDEILAVGDESFQRKCLARIARADGGGRDAGAGVARPDRDRARRASAWWCSTAGEVAFDGADRRGPALLPPPARDGARRRRGRCAPRRRARSRWPSSSCSTPTRAPRAHVPARRGDARRADAATRRRRSRAGVVALEVRDMRGETLLPHRRVGRPGARATRRSPSTSRGWPAGRRLRPGGRRPPTRTRRTVMDRLARFSVARDQRRRGRGRPARRVDASRTGGGGAVTTPEDARRAARARRRRASAREGGYPGAAGRARWMPRSAAARTSRGCASGRSSRSTRELVYSTRTGGAPITWFKRLLLRLLRQYTIELEAQQTRFNVGVRRATSRASRSANARVTRVHQVLSGAGPVRRGERRRRSRTGALFDAWGMAGGVHAAAIEPRVRGDVRAAGATLRAGAGRPAAVPLLGLRAAAASRCSSGRSASCSCTTTSRPRTSCGSTSRTWRRCARWAATSCRAGRGRCDVAAAVSEFNARRAARGGRARRARACRSCSTRSAWPSAARPPRGRRPAGARRSAGSRRTSAPTWRCARSSCYRAACAPGRAADVVGEPLSPGLRRALRELAGAGRDDHRPA